MQRPSSSQISTVEIVGPADGWILEKLARRLAAKLPYAEFAPWAPRIGSQSKLVYYINYAIFQSASEKIDVGFFTHVDHSHEFMHRAQMMDHCVSMSKLYADYMRDHGITEVTHIPMGFDYYRYRPRLVLGVFGRLEHPRKGAELVAQLKHVPFVDLLTTEGNLDEAGIRNAYQMVDYVLIPATVEGGPMCLLEGLCMGKPVIAPLNVGMVSEFGYVPQIVHYEAGNFASLHATVERCYLQKLETSNLTKERTWDNWAENHHHLFQRLLHEQGMKLVPPAHGFRFGMLSELEFGPKVDVTDLETELDSVARELYFGRYREASSLLKRLSTEFPFVERLLDSIPQGNIAIHDQDKTTK